MSRCNEIKKVEIRKMNEKQTSLFHYDQRLFRLTHAQMVCSEMKRYYRNGLVLLICTVRDSFLQIGVAECYFFPGNGMKKRKNKLNVTEATSEQTDKCSYTIA